MNKKIFLLQSTQYVFENYKSSKTRNAILSKLQKINAYLLNDKYNFQKIIQKLIEKDINQPFPINFIYEVGINNKPNHTNIYICTNDFLIRPIFYSSKQILTTEEELTEDMIKFVSNIAIALDCKITENFIEYMFKNINKLLDYYCSYQINKIINFIDEYQYQIDNQSQYHKAELKFI